MPHPTASGEALVTIGPGSGWNSGLRDSGKWQPEVTDADEAFRPISLLDRPRNQAFQFNLFQLSASRVCMWNEPTLEDLAKLPGLYETENTPLGDTVIHEHFFLGGCDWYAAEYSAEERNFFGYAILNDDLQNAEWGYFSYDELRSVNAHGIEVDRDLHWNARRASDVSQIVRAGGV